MSQQLSLFKYFQPKSANKRWVEEDDTNHVIRKCIDADIQMCVNKIIKDTAANKKNVKNVITKENVNNVKKTENSVKKSVNISESKKKKTDYSMSPEKISG